MSNYQGKVNSDITYHITSAQPIDDRMSKESLSDLLQLDFSTFIYPGMIVSVQEKENIGVYVLYSGEENSDLTSFGADNQYMFIESGEESAFEYDKENIVTKAGKSLTRGWKKIGEGSGGGSGIDVEDNEGATTKGTTINNDGDVTGTVENGSITLNIDWSKIECICGGNSVTGGTTITDTDGTGLTIDNITLKTNGDGKEDTGDENIIYVAQTDGGTWD